jgi:hypothetical protein
MALFRSLQCPLNLKEDSICREEITQAVRRAVDMVDQGLIREDEIDVQLLGEFVVGPLKSLFFWILFLVLPSFWVRPSFLN